MRIELEKVSTSWGDVQAVDQVSFTAPAGELLVVLGPSGCGKSSVLRLIAGLETVSAGAIRIEGNYDDTRVKALAALKASQPVQLSVLFSIDVFELMDQDVLVSFDEVATSAEDKQWLSGFYPALMENSKARGKIWGVPFQRSTIVMYHNKDAFKEAGLDPNKPPATWDEMVAMSQKLVKKDASGNVTRWGEQIPSTGGGSFYLFKKTTPAKRTAALKFIKFMTAPELSARWSMATGYVATSQAAYDTATLKKYVADLPAAAVARDQFPHSVAEFSVHENARVKKLLDDAIQSVLTGGKPPKDALTGAQQQAERVLKDYR